MVTNPIQIVQSNFDFYNARNLQGFMSCFSDDIVIFNFKENKITANGIYEVSKIYENVFRNSPKLNSTIVNRIVFENKVIDHEKIAGRMGLEDTVEMVLIYEVNDNKISKISVIK